MANSEEWRNLNDAALASRAMEFGKFAPLTGEQSTSQQIAMAFQRENGDRRYITGETGADSTHHDRLALMEIPQASGPRTEIRESDIDKHNAFQIPSRDPENDYNFFSSLSSHY